MTTNTHNIYLYCSRYSQDHDYRADEDIIFAHPRLAYVAKGCCHMRTNDRQELTINEGNVWFLPKGVPYRSCWTATPYVEFIFVEFDVDLMSSSYSTFSVANAPHAEALFRDTLSAYENGDTIGALKSLFTLLDAYLPDPETGIPYPYDTVAPAIAYLDKHYTEPVHVATLARLCTMSRSRFYTVFKSVTRQTPIEYKNSLKVQHAVRLIKQGATLEDVCDRLNFASPAFLRKMIWRTTGLLPKEIKHGKQKM